MNEKYTPPTPIEVRQILKAFDLTGGKAAEQTGIKNSRAFRKFTTEGKASKAMDYSVLFTLVAKNIGRFISIDSWRDELAEEKVLVRKKPDYKHDSGLVQKQSI